MRILLFYKIQKSVGWISTTSVCVFCDSPLGFMLSREDRLLV